jgi:hypothetical protein
LCILRAKVEDEDGVLHGPKIGKRPQGPQSLEGAQRRINGRFSTFFPLLVSFLHSLAKKCIFARHKRTQP